MPIKKILMKSGVNRENTRYYTEGGWYDCDKVRFRQGSPQKLGGWTRISDSTYTGVCRSLWAWESLYSVTLIGVGTNEKFYVSRGGNYYDITPIRAATNLTSPFTATTGSKTIAVHAPLHGCINGDFVTYNGATALGGAITTTILNAEFQITYVDEDNYTITTTATATSGDTGHGGTPRAVYQINIGPEYQTPLSGWGTGGWGLGAWGIGDPSPEAIRVWSQSNYGEDLIFGRRGGAMYYYYASRGVTPSLVTITNASPAVVTVPLDVITAANQYKENAPLLFDTTGALPAGVTTGTIYYVRNYLNAGASCTFNLSTTPKGPYVNTSSAGSGTHSISIRAVPLTQINGAYEENPVTITIAAPAVITLTDTGSYSNGMGIYFDSSGALPTGLSTGVIYYVQNYVTASGVSTFNVALTPNGTSITTTGTQSGTQYTYLAVPAVPVIQNYITVSDTYRFVFAFGCNDYGTEVQSPLLVRWSDQENAAIWTPLTTNQAGSITLTRGSQIITALQTRQEVLVWTDSTLYSMQYLGYPLVWNAQLMGDNISIVGENAAALASGVVYWMGRDKFYKYDGRVQTLNCDLREYVFGNFNSLQNLQTYAGTNEGFNEVWWFYCSENSTSVDRYVVYNYLEDIWYYGTMGRTAWLDTGILEFPLGATYVNNLVNHESGVDNNEVANTESIESYITSSEVDIDDGHQFVFIRRVLPDITFRGSTTENPTATLSIMPMLNSGSGYTDPASVGGSTIPGNEADVTRTATVPIEQFTGQVFIRVRGRQFAFKVYNNQLGSMWQMGAMRLDMKTDGQRG